MTHELEADYHERVTAYLKEEYGEANVETEHVFEETQRRVDCLVSGPLVDFAVEVERSFDAAITGVGQAELYAGHGHNVVPVIVLPPDHTVEPEATILRDRGVHLIELDV